MATSRSSFTTEQDVALKTAVDNYDGPEYGKWVTIALSVPDKDREQCRERWTSLKPKNKAVWPADVILKVARAHAVTPKLSGGKTDWVAITRAAGVEDRGPKETKDMARLKGNKKIFEQVAAELAERTGSAAVLATATLARIGHSNDSEGSSDAPRLQKKTKTVTEAGDPPANTKKKSKSKLVADVDSSSGSSSGKRKDAIGAPEGSKKKKKKSVSASSRSGDRTSRSSGRKRSVVSSDDDDVVITTKTKKTRRSSNWSGKRSGSGSQKNVTHSYISKEITPEQKEAMARVLDIRALPSPDVLARCTNSDDIYNKPIPIDTEKMMAMLEREGYFA